MPVPKDPVKYAQFIKKMSAAKTGKHHSPETIKKMSAAVKVAMNRPEVKAKIRAAHLGKKYPKISAALLGKKCPKISAAKRGKKQNRKQEYYPKMSAAKTGKNHPMFGKHHSPEAIEKMSAAKKRYLKAHPDALTGENNPNWQGGISNFPYAFVFNEAFKQMVCNRDGNVCQLCGKTKEQEGKNLCVHHIYYDKNNECENPDEFVALCRRCNSKVNARRDFWTDWFTFKQIYSFAYLQAA